MATKNDEPVRSSLRAGDERKALRLAAAYRHLGPQKERISRGAQAMRDPDFYREIGLDPDKLVADGVAAVRERFGTENDDDK